MASRLSPGRRMQTTPAISAMTPMIALSARLVASPVMASRISMNAVMRR